MKRQIEKLDFLSPSPAFKIKQNDKFKTFIGGSVSLLTYLLIFAVGGYFVSQMFTKVNKTITYNVMPSSNVSRNMSAMPYMIMLQNNFFYPFENESRTYFIHTEIWTTKRNNESGVSTTRVVVYQEPCDINKHFGEYKDYFSEVAWLKNYYCPVPGQNSLNLFGLYGSKGDYSYLSHYISKCQNGSIYNGNVSNCYDVNTLNSAMQNSFVSFKFLEYSMDHNNINSPGTLTLRSEAMPVSTTIFKREWFYVRQIFYTTDQGFIFEDNQIQEYYKVSVPKETVDLRAQGTIPGSFAMVTMIMDSQVDYYSRNFQKAQNVLANVGGVIKGFIVIAQILTYLITEEIYYLALVTSLFKINEHPLRTHRMIYKYLFLFYFRANIKNLRARSSTLSENVTNEISKNINNKLAGKKNKIRNGSIAKSNLSSISEVLKNE